MQLNRRRFLQQGTLAALATVTLPSWASAAAKKKFITGVQLYSVREDMRKDPLATLKAVAEMGYKNVEHANYVNRKFYGFTATEFKKILNDLGMKMPSGHTVMGASHWDATKKDFTDSWKYTIEDAAVVGQELVISPSLESGLRKSKDDMLRFMEVFNKSGELCKKSGMRFGYHNHDFEFTQMMGTETMYEVMLNNTDPSMVTQQFDMGNLYGTGADALAIVKKYPGRFVSMHVKDEIKRANGNGYESTILGKGVQLVKEIVEEGLKNGGTTHLIVEQEAYQGITPIECIKEDYNVMKKWGFKGQ